MNRRLFIEQSLRIGAGVSVPAGILTFQSACRETNRGREFKSDIVIIGGGLGGCAAALASCSQGALVIMTEPTDWIGGQVSQQGVPPDEHQWIESFGRTRTYAKFRELVRAHYRNHYPLSSKALESSHLNPGSGLVSRLCHEPGVGLAVLESMLAPEIHAGRLRVFLNTRPVEADVLGDRILAVTCMDERKGDRVVLQGKMFIDASEEGDLLPLAGAEYVIGAESRKQTGEPHAPEEADPGNIQSMTWCFAIDHLEG